MARPSKKKHNSAQIRWFLIARTIGYGVGIGIFVLIASWILFWPDTQYKIRQWILMRRYPGANTYKSQFLPSANEQSKKSYVQYLYAVNFNNSALEEVTHRNKTALFGHIFYSDNRAYFIEPSRVLRFNLSDRSLEPIYTESDTTRQITRIISIQSDTLYFSETEKKEGDMPTVMYVYALNLRTQRTEAPFQVKVGIYQAPIEVFQAGGNQYVVLSGGDGCGGQENVVRVAGNSQSIITEFGIGCISGPRYIDFVPAESKVLAVAPFGERIVENQQYCHYDVLYTFDVATSSVEPIYDLKQISGCIKNMVYDRVSNHVAVVTDSVIYNIDITQRTIIKTIPFDRGETEPYFSNLFGTKLVGYSRAAHDIVIVDLEDEGNKRINMPAGNYTPIFLGIKDNKLFFTYDVIE